MPWRVTKYYLPAWPGGGGTYDDEVPPPDATVHVDASGRDAATGAPYAEIGQWSRAAHATQGMGHWSALPQTSWTLHLKSGNGGDEQGIGEGLPGTLVELGVLFGGTAGAALQQAHAAVGAAIAAFPQREAIVAALAEAAVALDRADATLSAEQRADHGHRIGDKRMELDAALLLASGVTASAWLDANALPPGGNTTLNVHVDADVPVEVRPVAAQPFAVSDGETRDGITRFRVQVADDAPLSIPFAEGLSRLGANGPLGIEISADVGGRSVRRLVDLETAAVVAPAHRVGEIEPLLLRRPIAAEPYDVLLRSEGAGAPSLAPQPGFGIAPIASGARLTPSADLAAGRYRLPVTIDGSPAYHQRPVAYPHIGRTQAVTPAALDVLALDLRLPDTRIGYVGGGADHVGDWLPRMGLDVVPLEFDQLGGDLSGFATIVVGIFAFGQRRDLAAAVPALHQWVRDGGHLVTLYHRPSDGWDPDRTPPAHVRIGSPSLRWRVTDPAAPVTVLAPGHKLLAGPNVIGPDDWAGWDKERGLYFASEWDPAYVPLLSMHDRDEAPLTGALISAPIGHGRHTHTSLVLHHQMDHLVPGAFRLMANLMQRA
jgi:hypothetical protein